ncbi:MAG TPA: biotin--[acetyl-CoA-carboxylase] ligase [Patescibacteria group bacterium]|nr:biotin--[acetyl-CoA-carboxylase] ligase [Patescibacteria group bacterium]
MTTYPDHFKHIHLDRCESTSDYIRQNLSRLEADFPLMVTAGTQLSGHGRDGRGWFSMPDLGIYATFAFHLGSGSGLPLLAITSGVAVAEMLGSWTKREFALKWPNDILAGGKKIAGIICENMVRAEKITCLVGIGINVNQQAGDFPVDLRERAGSLKTLTGVSWPVAAGSGRLAAALAARLKNLQNGQLTGILRQARWLSRSYLRRQISFHYQGQILRGEFCGLAADGALLLKVAGQETKVFYSGEWLDR